jgi:transposase
MFRVARASAIRARTQAFHILFGTMIAAPSEVRDGLVGLTKRTLVNRCFALEPQTEDLLELIDDPEQLVIASVKFALRDLARRWKALDHEAKDLERQIQALVSYVAPGLIEIFGVSTELAGQFLVTAGDNPERIRNEAAFARLCGVCPKPASSGLKNNRHRLNRGGDRGANSALWMVAVVRLRHHEPTREYVARRTAEGLSKREIIRCLKRYIAREVFAALPRSSAEAALVAA